MEFVEITIEMPWGHIAGKAWGNKTDFPVIALHGYQDNANSFDKLIPLLPKSFYYICIDLPGHGKSMPIPTPTLINIFDMILCLKIVLDRLDRKKYILLGHSFGARTAIFFTQMYPHYVTKLISLDGIYYIPLPPERFIVKMIDCFKKYEKLHHLDMNSAPSYTLEEAVKKMMDGRFVPISREAAEIIVRRSLIPAENGKFKISTAQHLKYPQRPPFTSEFEAGLIQKHPIRCPFLQIGASKTSYYRDIVKEVIVEFKKLKNYEHHILKGGHDLHIDEPEKVASIINKFLVKNVNKL